MDRRRFLALSAPAVAALAGCTDGNGTPTDSGGTPTGTATDSPTPTASPTTTDTATATDTETPTSSPTATATPVQNPDQRVVVAPDNSFRFEPETFEITTGETVLWEWRNTSSGHNVSPAEGGIPSGSEWSGDDETTYQRPHFHAHTFEVAGEYAYHCDPHQTQGMTGSFTVE